MHRIGPFNAFPPELQGDMNGAFYERPIRNGSASLYLIIRPKRYMTDRDRELVEQGHFSIDELNPGIKLLGRYPHPDTLWLYEVESFEVNREHHENQEVFSDNANKYNCLVFDNYDEMMKYCREEFSVSAEDFRKSWSTNYPQS